MLRIVGVLVALAFIVLVWRMPNPPVVRLAALDAYRLMEQELPDGRTFGEAVLEMSAMSIDPDDPARAEFELGGVFIAPEPEALESGRVPEGDLDAHVLARNAVVRGLREQASAQGLSLFFGAEHMAASTSPDKANFVLYADVGSIRATCFQEGREPLQIDWEDWRAPRRTSVVPPLVAIFLAILLRRPVVALFAGVWAATWLLRSADGVGAAKAVGLGVVDIGTQLFWPKFVDSENAQIIGFVVLMLAMVGVMTRSGGIRGMMDHVARLAKGPRSTQFATYLIGLGVFFDDYANTVLVGSTMRPLTDRFRISREKLAYIVDSTAAPVAGLAILSTWIAFEVSTFSPQLPAAGLSAADGYAVFLQTLPFRFYCLLTLVAVPVVALSGRDFGPMLAAERRARRTGEVVAPGSRPMVGHLATRLEPVEGLIPRGHRALLPLLSFVVVTLVSILWRGGAFDMSAAEAFSLEGMSRVLYDGSGAFPILLGSATGFALAAILAFGAGLRGEIFSAAWTTLRAMFIALVILYLAWMIGLACEKLGTASYLRALIGSWLAPEFLPGVLFLLSAAVAFSTGSSWSTMGILLPLVVGLAFDLGERGDIGGHLLLLISIGAVLDGAIFGDHCSPISDTTVLSSTASASDHIDHVRTQAPYALLTMVVALLVGYAPCAVLGWNPFLMFAVAAVLQFVLFRGLSKPIETAVLPAATAPPGSTA